MTRTYVSTYDIDFKNKKHSRDKRNNQIFKDHWFVLKISIF